MIIFVMHCYRGWGCQSSLLCNIYFISGNVSFSAITLRLLKVKHCLYMYVSSTFQQHCYDFPFADNPIEVISDDVIRTYFWNFHLLTT